LVVKYRNGFAIVKEMKLLYNTAATKQWTTK